MAITTEAKVIAQFNLPSELTGKLDGFITPASAKIIDLIGQTKYDELEALPDADPDRERAEHAEGSLSLYYAMPNLNLRFTSKGGLVKAAGFDQSRTELMSKRELDSYRGELWSEAFRLLDGAGWIIQPEDEDGESDGFEGSFSMVAI